MSRGDGRNDPADRPPPPQAAEISCYSVAEEIMSICVDFLVELRGFEPLTSAVRHPRFPFQPLRFHAAIDKEKWRESHFAVIANGRLTSTPAVR
jgi:hypothetical protein